ncbi:hypothetical protein ACRAQ6_13735 [Erythrobacter sp. HA6-11]
MYNHSFFQTKLGHASLASVSAMVLFVALATQMQFAPTLAFAADETVDPVIAVELA